MSVAGNQQRIFLALAAQLAPHWRRDRNLPARIQSLLAGNRAFGSRDRRLYRELLYTTLRYLPWFEAVFARDADAAARLAAWLVAETPATHQLREELLTSWPTCPASAAAKADILRAAAPHPVFVDVRLSAVDLVPVWFGEEFSEATDPRELDALLARAPLWLRLQTEDPTPVFAEFAERGWRAEASPALPSAVRLLDEADVTKTRAFERGWIEVQDLGSQLLLESVGVRLGERWFDACAGAGGKTLQLARLLGPAGHVDAADIRPAALNELALRSRRAGLSNVTIVRSPADRTYDGVLVDAPCSGSGTWRRAPHLKWCTDAAQIKQAAATQRELLHRFSDHVRPGGRLIYATCSLCRSENEDVIDAFLAEHPPFAIEPPARDFGARSRSGGLTFLPSRFDSDGFFVAALRRR